MAKLKLKDPNIRVLLMPSLVIVISALSLLFMFRDGYPRAMAKYSEVQEAKKVENTYKARLDVLKDFSKSPELGKTDTTFLLMPDKNPGAIFLNQVKSYLLKSNLAFMDIQFIASENNNDNINKADISLQVIGDDYISAIEFLRSLTKMAPLTTIKEAKLEKDGPNINSKLIATIYWSNFPEKLPSLNEPLKDLTSSDKETLKLVSGFSLPELTASKPEVTTQQRDNPFE